MHRLLLIAFGVNIAFGNMCTMTFAQTAEDPASMQGMSMPCHEQTQQHTATPCTETHHHAVETSHDCDDGSCFLHAGSTDRGLSLHHLSLSFPSVSILPQTSDSFRSLVALSVPVYSCDMYRPPPDALGSVTMRL